MKIQVTRFIRDGVYYVSFASKNVTPEDAAQFEKFGIPVITIQIGPPVSRRDFPAYINNLQPNMAAGFATEEEAKDYEAKLLASASLLMEALKKKKDQFTSTTEVEF
jgi:hypothetical protein